MAMSRQWLNWSVVQLETEFERASAAGDGSALQALLAELAFRETSRAQRLRERVLQAVAALAGASSRDDPVDESKDGGERVDPPDEIGADLPPPRPPRIEDPRRPPAARRSVPRTPPPQRLDRADAERLLSAWTAIEVLSPPQTYRRPVDLAEGDQRRVAVLERGRPLPWTLGERARPNTRLFYQIVVGAIDMEAVTTKLLQEYGDEDIERSRPSGFTPIAILTVDNRGIPSEPTACALSSFAWGLPLALRRQLTALGEWPSVEPKLIADADEVVRRVGEDGVLLPVDIQTIDALFRHLVGKLGLPENCLSAPEFALRIFHYWKAEEPPDPPPMGSFFLGDLAKARTAVAGGALTEPLARYLALSVPGPPVDLDCDDPALAEALAPRRIPAGRWPSPGAYPLVLLQQSAVNLAIDPDADTTLLPVNGPPGTGKTTLLRDLVAAIVVQRARAMATFDDPGAAFAPSGARFRSGGGFTHHYEIDEKLAGFEILVASSNNKAVENVSAELPGIGAVDRSRTDLRYFKSVADSVARGPRTDTDENPRAASPEDRGNTRQSWGLIAAILGNARNRYAFRQTAWVDEDHGLRAYLMEASGNPQEIEIKDPGTGLIVERRKPRVVSTEKPPSDADAALRRWKSARRRFLDTLKRVDARLDILEAGRAALRPDELGQRRREAEIRLARADSTAAEARRKRDGDTQASRHLAAEKAQIERALLSHEQAKPGVVGRLFGSAYADWENERTRMVQRRESLARGLRDAEAALGQALRDEATRNGERVAAVQGLAKVDAEIDASSSAIRKASELAGGRFVDAAFLERDRTDLQRDTPWLDAQTQSARDDVFAAAMALHRAFADVAAKQVRHNLDLLFRAFFGKQAWGEKLRPLMPGLWTTFFTVIPVVSTTFASIERMFGYLGPRSLGWLLVDEAGQAAPQATVGALMRTRRAVVVGDPLQLPPVTSLPTDLAGKIAREFGVDQHRFLAPAASVQSLADASSVYGSTIRTAGDAVRVGVPLVVHRRCAEPMFSLSNQLAYGGKMVQGRGERPSAIRSVLGPSRWIDVKPDRCEDKWSEAEGRAVLGLFRELGRSDVDNLDLYLISPFRIVAQRLRELLVSERALARWTSEPREWVKERVGTVYTVQGREADTIVMVLGAAQPERRGARSWAGEHVNQLNVAVTRAKENIYVIGNRFEWASAGTFEHLVRALR